MDTTFVTGIIGSIVLVAGAAWPIEKVKHPILSIKNWLFLVGGLLMLVYAILNYYINQAPFFFVIFEIFLAFTAVLMMANTDDRLDTILVTIATIGFVIWSIMLFEDYGTIVFIVGLSTIGLGYTLEMGSIRRSLALSIGSALIAIFSYITATWVFFWLNLFFCLFSLYYLVDALLHPPRKIRKRTHRIKH